jgi:hypothetical protein
MSQAKDKAEARRKDVIAGLERLRGAVRLRVPPRDQGQFLDVIDQIQTQVLAESTGDKLLSSIQLTRDTARRVLRQRPSDMVQLLNELDGIADEVTAFLQLLTKG